MDSILLNSISLNSHMIFSIFRFSRSSIVLSIELRVRDFIHTAYNLVTYIEISMYLYVHGNLYVSRQGSALVINYGFLEIQFFLYVNRNLVLRIFIICHLQKVHFHATVIERFDSLTLWTGLDFALLVVNAALWNADSRPLSGKKYLVRTKFG